jgi:hypothetical protein
VAEPIKRGGPVKPTVEQLGLDVGTMTWQRSGVSGAAIEVAFAGDWVLLRVTDDPAGRVLVFDEFEWECFLDGAKNGEFDDAAP